METATKQSYYDLLGVPETATQEEIRKAYLKLAHRHHPDKTGGNKASEETLKQVNEAYDTLKSPERRKAYDAARANPFADMGGNPGQGADFTQYGFESSISLDELLGGIFGKSHEWEHKGARPGHDIETTVTVTLRDIANGTRKSMQLRDPVSGETRHLDVTIPPGAPEGMRLRLAGQGGPGEQGGLPGDLYVMVRTAPDPIFRREGDHLFCETTVSYPDAALGVTIQVPALKGSAKLRIPPGTPSGKTFRMRGLGLPSLGDKKRGDQLVRVQITVPQSLSARERALLEELRSIRT